MAAYFPLEETAQNLFEAAGFTPPCILLESGRPHPTTGRYSFILGEPVACLSAREGQIANPLTALQEMLDAKPTARLPGFPPFVGGMVGFFGFDLYRHLEALPARAQNDLHLPDLYGLFFDQAIVLDHLTKTLWVIVLADPTMDPNQSYPQALGRVEALTKRVQRSREGEGENFASYTPHSGSFTVSSTHTQGSFEAMVRQAKAYIAKGDIYQANLSQRLQAPLTEGPWRLYRRLQRINPSPFSAFADLGFLQVISASPERLLQVTGRSVETRPIAGTRPRGATEAERARLRRELILNEKERAEHLMLVDLERNDLGRVCRYGSVQVNERMIVEEYSHVIHIVSNVRGLLRPEVRAAELISAVFPGGTITGCPKIRSIEIIDSLEPVRRQWYTGSLGYVSFTGDMDLNLLIRSAFVVEGQIYVQTGAGIVADSDPGREYEETLYKAQALMEALHAEEPTALLV